MEGGIGRWARAGIVAAGGAGGVGAPGGASAVLTWLNCEASEQAVRCLCQAGERGSDEFAGSEASSRADKAAGRLFRLKTLWAKLYRAPTSIHCNVPNVVCLGRLFIDRETPSSAIGLFGSRYVVAELS